MTGLDSVLDILVAIAVTLSTLTILFWVLIAFTEKIKRDRNRQLEKIVNEQKELFAVLFTNASRILELDQNPPIRHIKNGSTRAAGR